MSGWNSEEGWAFIFQEGKDEFNWKKTRPFFSPKKKEQESLRWKGKK